MTIYSSALYFPVIRPSESFMSHFGAEPEINAHNLALRAEKCILDVQNEIVSKTLKHFPPVGKLSNDDFGPGLSFLDDIAQEYGDTSLQESNLDILSKRSFRYFKMEHDKTKPDNSTFDMDEFSIPLAQRLALLPTGDHDTAMSVLGKNVCRRTSDSNFVSSLNKRDDGIVVWDFGKKDNRSATGLSMRKNMKDVSRIENAVANASTSRQLSSGIMPTVGSAELDASDTQPRATSIVTAATAAATASSSTSFGRRPWSSSMLTATATPTTTAVTGRRPNLADYLITATARMASSTPSTAGLPPGDRQEDITMESMEMGE